MLSRNANLLALQSPKETYAFISPRGILTSGLLALPFQNQTSITKGGGLKEVVPRGEGEQEGEMQREVQSPVRKTRTEKKKLMFEYQSKMHNIPGHNHWLLQLSRKLGCEFIVDKCSIREISFFTRQCQSLCLQSVDMEKQTEKAKYFRVRCILWQR